MKIKFLGTGASESIPGLFCNCPVCANARKVGGKEIRTRMGVMINDDLMIDFSPDVNTNTQKYGINLHNLKYLLITHSHSDHFNVDDLCLRNSYNIVGTEDKLQVFSNKAVVKKCEEYFATYECTEVTVAKTVFPEKPFWAGDYKITPLKSRHINNEEEDSVVFLIEQKGKTYLHLVDSGELFPEVFEYLHKNKIVADVIAVDTTFSLCGERYFGHLNLEQVLELCEKLKEIGVIQSHTEVLLTHIAHFATHADIEKACQGRGVIPAYDGLEIEI